ncbi:hypothetical protein EOM60_04920 [Candidatus Saccharibacteria bacterium]|nr:hypothetical protein [Candidatus Saccharibacteria bacterium]
MTTEKYPITTKPTPSGWEDLSSSSENREVPHKPDADYYAQIHGLELESEYVALGYSKNKKGEVVPVYGRPFSGSRILKAPIQRNGGAIDTEGWFATGVCEKVGDDGQRMFGYVFIKPAKDIDLIKIIEVNEQNELMERLRGQQQVVNDARTTSSGTEDRSQNVKEVGDFEAVILHLLPEDQVLVRSFAYRSKLARDTLGLNLSFEYRTHQAEIGKLLEQMSEEARRVAPEYFRLAYKQK